MSKLVTTRNTTLKAYHIGSKSWNVCNSHSTELL